MAVKPIAHIRRTELLQLRMVTQRLDALGRFYCDAFGFRSSPSQYCPGGESTGAKRIGGGHRSLTLQLGRQCIALIEFDEAGQPYPADCEANSPAFQHFAIVVSDMELAFRRLCQVPGWSAISHDGPQQLPDTSGGVTAFKFRDPEGHPLELLAFPADRVPLRWQHQVTQGTALGIDHTAIVVKDADASVGFYRLIGLRVAARSRNMGPAQAGLDGLTAPDVDVIALNFSVENPHLELLRYRAPKHAAPAPIEANDVAATRIVIATSEGPAEECDFCDPDGHWLVVTRIGDGWASRPIRKTDNAFLSMRAEADPQGENYDDAVGDPRSTSAT